MESPSVRGTEGLSSLLSLHPVVKQSHAYQKTFETKGLSNVITEEIRTSASGNTSKPKRKISNSSFHVNSTHQPEERKSSNLVVVQKEQTENKQTSVKPSVASNFWHAYTNELDYWAYKVEEFNTRQKTEQNSMNDKQREQEKWKTSLLLNMEHSLSQFNRDFCLDSSSISKELNYELQHDTPSNNNLHKEEFDAMRKIPIELSISLLVELRAFEESMDKISGVYSNDSVTLSVSKSASPQSITASPLQRRLFQKQLKVHEDTDDEFFSCDDDDDEEEEEVEEEEVNNTPILEFSGDSEEKDNYVNKEPTS